MNEGTGEERRKRTRKVRPYPVHTLEESLALAGAIHHSNSGLPFDRTLLARALGTTPASSSFTMRLNSSAKYGLTQGGYNDDSISITPRGEATVAPKGTDERQSALRDAALEPDVFRRFYELLDGKLMPQAEFAQNLLQRELSIRPDLAAECYRIVEANGLFTGILDRLSGGDVNVVLTKKDQSPSDPITPLHAVPAAVDPSGPVDAPGEPAGRVFIGSSSGSSDATQYVMSVLDEFGVPYSTGTVRPHEGPGLTAEVSDEMRRCSAAVLILSSPTDPDPETEQGLTASLLYQLGAASVLYGSRVLIVLSDSVELTQDLYAGLLSIVYEPAFPERAGMTLMAALKTMGVIKVVSQGS